MAADWSQLPKELLQQISERLNSQLYLLRFRSVCSSWRSSITPNYHHNNHLQLLKFSNPNKNDSSTGYLIRYNIFLIKPPPTHNHETLHPWLIRIGPKLTHKTRLCESFDNHQRLPFDFPHVLDSNQLSVVDIGHMFYIIEGDLLQNPYKYNHVLSYRKKVVAATCHREEEPLVIVTYDYFDEPMMFRCSGDNNSWTKIPNLSESCFGDICVFKGRPCVVDKTGLTVMISSDLSIHLVAEPLFCGGLKSLVESDCELLLVDRYFSDDGGGLRINVFRLDEKEKKWVKLTNLGDKVLFLGDVCSFSASASDLGFAHGNCVIFNSHDDDPTDCEMIAFHLDQGQVLPLSDYPDYSKLFRPPPEWMDELHS